MTFQELRSRILKRDGYKCQQCNKENGRLQVDHIVPKHNGGLDSLQNLRTLCYDCHQRRHSEERFTESIKRGLLRYLFDEIDRHSVDTIKK